MTSTDRLVVFAFVSFVLAAVLAHYWTGGRHV